MITCWVLRVVSEIFKFICSPLPLIKALEGISFSLCFSFRSWNHFSIFSVFTRFSSDLETLFNSECVYNTYCSEGVVGRAAESAFTFGPLENPPCFVIPSSIFRDLLLTSRAR